MKKFYKFFLIAILINFSLPSHAHVEHYENLKLIEFDIYRNGKNIGTHIFSFKRNNDHLEVEKRALNLYRAIEHLLLWPPSHQKFELGIL
mgnify:CR=1 FL=1